MILTYQIRGLNGKRIHRKTNSLRHIRKFLYDIIVFEVNLPLIGNNIHSPCFYRNINYSSLEKYFRLLRTNLKIILSNRKVLFLYFKNDDDNIEKNLAMRLE